MRRYPVTLNPSTPATHTGLGPELRRRRRRPVLPVIPAGQAGTYAGAIGGRSSRSSSAPAEAPPAASEEGCCG